MQSICSDGPGDDSGTGSSYITRRRSEPGLSSALESSSLRFLGGGVLRIILHGLKGFFYPKAPKWDKMLEFKTQSAILVFRSFKVEIRDIVPGSIYAHPNGQFRDWDLATSTSKHRAFSIKNTKKKNYFVFDCILWKEILKGYQIRLILYKFYLF